MIKSIYIKTFKVFKEETFILDKNKETPTVFIVTQNDNTSYNYGKKGLVRVTLYEHVFNPDTDNADLGICDYIDVMSQRHNDLLKSKKVFFN